MKKLSVLFAFALIVFRALANPIDAEKARQIAANFFQTSQTYTLVTSGVSMSKSFKNSTSTPPYYIYSRGEGQGYVIVAGDDCMPVILGYTESGDFDASNIPPALLSMMEGWAAAVEKAQASGTNTPRVEAANRSSDTRDNITAIMSSHWHQSAPYNIRCPYVTGTTNRCLTGCVATAASQILYYWRADLTDSLLRSTPTYNYGCPVTESIPKGTKIRWSLMKDKYSGSESDEVKDAVAEFCFATGAATWLTYGTSTSGQISDVPNTFSSYYGMHGGSVYYRDSYSQENWEDLLYNELSMGRPVFYVGTHPEQGGHAVVVHGYNKSSNLFLFNFGWGGQSDGYYTVDQSTGMNGFYQYQACIIGAYPSSWNMTTEIKAPDVVYAQRTNSFDITITNNSTISHQGFYLFASTSSSKPTSLKSAKSSDTESVVEKGETLSISLTCKPTSTKTWYITLTDAELTVLKQIEVTPQIASSKLSLNNLVAASSSEIEEYEGIKYNKFYSSKAVINATISNASDVTYEGTGKINIYVYDEEQEEWSLNGSYSASGVEIPSESSSDITFNVSNTSSCPLVAGNHYYAEIASPWKTSVSEDEIDTSEAECSRVYFVITGESDLAVSSFENGILSLTGHWDKYSFETLAKRTTYSSATVYNLIQVQGFVANYDRTVLPSPNALVYVSDTEVYDDNIINMEGICGELQIKQGYNFSPQSDFKVSEAKLEIVSQPGRWSLLTVPFRAKVADGVYARRIDSHSSSGININSVSDVDTLLAGQTYLVMTSCSNLYVYAIPDDGETFSTVTTTLTINPDPAIIGTFEETTIPVGAFVIDDGDTQYFVPATTETQVSGLTGYFSATNVTKKFRVNVSLAVDPAYITLALNIERAWEIYNECLGIRPDFECEAFGDSIYCAMKEFSYRKNSSLTSATLIKNYAARLLELGEALKNGKFVETKVEAVALLPDDTTIESVYTITGQRIPSLQKGINIVRMSNGKTKKVLVR